MTRRWVFPAEYGDGAPVVAVAALTRDEFVQRYLKHSGMATTPYGFEVVRCTCSSYECPGWQFAKPEKPKNRITVT